MEQSASTGMSCDSETCSKCKLSQKHESCCDEESTEEQSDQKTMRSLSNVTGNPSARKAINYRGETEEQSFRNEQYCRVEEVTHEYSELNAMSCGCEEIKEKQSARNDTSFVNKRKTEEQAPRNVKRFCSCFCVEFPKEELARKVMSCCGEKITEMQSSQVEQLRKLNEPATFISELDKNDNWLSIDMTNVTPLFESIMQALNEQYCISLAGSKSEFYIRPPGVYFNDTDLRCTRKGCVAKISTNFECFSNIKDKLEFSVLYTCSIDKKSVSFGMEFKNTLHPIIKNVFASYSSKYRVVRENEDYSLCQTDEDFKCIRRHTISTTVGCSKDEITPFEGELELVSVHNVVRPNVSSIDFVDNWPDGIEEWLKICPKIHSRPNGSSVDFVEIIECINWPDGIEEWLNSSPKSGWPGKELKQKVISSGCDILIHTKSDEKSHHVGSITFSKAEQILINSWNPVQQAVYHVLRIFYCAELKMYIDKIITNHWLKTLMLWKCEESEPGDWTESNLIPICCELLQELKSIMVKTTNLRDYFLRPNTISDTLYFFVNSIGCDGRWNVAIKILEIHSNEANLRQWLSQTFCTNYIGTAQGSAPIAHLWNMYINII